MAFCTKCGKPLADDARFCGSCGSEERPVQQPAQQPTHQPQQPVSQPVAAGNVAAAVADTAVKAAKGGSFLKWVAVLAVIAAAVFAVNHFNLLNLFKSDETLIRERIEALEDAYNDGDWDGMMECLDGPTQAIMEMTMDFADGLISGVGGFDVSMRDMFSLGGLLLPGDNFRLEIKDINIDGDHAIVTVVMYAELNDIKESEEAELPMVKEDNDWYIGGLDNMLGSGLGF
ncbi:MAG: zinc ribbon domain-containing protein [Oscillospiraceae bacterium]|nr:zinc ribbon domain-containing protein [Oscillospiraceae bacterium]